MITHDPPPPPPPPSNNWVENCDPKFGWLKKNDGCVFWFVFCQNSMREHGSFKMHTPHHVQEENEHTRSTKHCALGQNFTSGADVHTCTVCVCYYSLMLCIANVLCCIFICTAHVLYHYTWTCTVCIDMTHVCICACVQTHVCVCV